MYELMFPKNAVSLANLNTPIKRLSRISKEMNGPTIWLKHDDQTGAALSGNKVRKLEYVIGEAVAQRSDVLITCGALQSNHCRATAIAAAMLGLDCHLILRGDAGQMPDGNLFLDALVGAEITVYPEKDFAKLLPERFKFWQSHYQNKNKRSWSIPTGASDEFGLWGYLGASKELQRDFEELAINPKAVVCATGSGGTQAGLTLGFALSDLSVDVIGMAVCDSKKYFERKVKADIRAWKSRFAAVAFVERGAPSDKFFEQIVVNTFDDYIGPGYSEAYPEMLETIAMLAKMEGVILDPCYGGKAFHGMLEEIKKGRWEQGDDIVFIHTGGIFGLFPYREAFDLSAKVIG